MTVPFSQTERLGRLTTDLGPDTLALLRFDGTDHLNDLFEYRVEALATRDDLDFDALVGTHASVEIEAHDRMRPFDGIVTSARWAGVGENGHRYDLILRPWFWLAGRRQERPDPSPRAARREALSATRPHRPSGRLAASAAAMLAVERPRQRASCGCAAARRSGAVLRWRRRDARRGLDL